MKHFTLLTAQPELVDWINQQPQKVNGSRLRADLDDAVTGDPKLIGPDGEDLGVFPMRDLLPSVRRAMVDHMGGPTIPGGDLVAVATAATARRVIYSGSTGDQQLAAEYKAYVNQDGGWEFGCGYLKGLSTKYIQILYQSRPVSNVDVEPRATLRERIARAINEHMARRTGKPENQTVPAPAPAEPERVQYMALTSHPKWSKGGTTDGPGWSLVIMNQASAPSDRLVITRSNRPVGEVVVEPLGSFGNRLHGLLDADPAVPTHPLIVVDRMPTGPAVAMLWLSGEEYVSANRGNGPDRSEKIPQGPDALTNLHRLVEAWQKEFPGAVVRDVDHLLMAVPMPQTAASKVEHPAPVALQADRPRFVGCMVCGQVNDAEWADGEVPPIAGMCDCGGIQFSACADPGNPTVGTVLNPVLVEASPATVEEMPVQKVEPVGAQSEPVADELDREEVVQLPTNSIVHGKNVRRKFRNLDELKESIRAVGIKVPLIVNRTDHGDELIAGERRLRVAKLLGLPTVPCIVRRLTDTEAYAQMLTENAHREPLTPVEWAEGYRHLIELGATQEKVAERFGLSRQSVGEHLRLLQLPDVGQAAVEDGMAIKAALVFLSKTEGVPDHIKHEVAVVFFNEKPSIRDAEAQLDMYLRMNGWARPQQKVEPPAAPPPAAPGPVTTPTTTNDTRAASPPAQQPATRQTTQPIQTAPTPGAQAPVREPQKPVVAPQQTEIPMRAATLRANGPRYWPGRESGESMPILATEQYLPLRQFHTFLSDLEIRFQRTGWEAGLVQIDASDNNLGIAPGPCIQASGIFVTDPPFLTLRTRNGFVRFGYSGSDVYYRMEITRRHEGPHAIRQQVVIQDCARYIVVTMNGAANMAEADFDALAEMINPLPGLPAGAEVLPHAG